MAVASRDGEEVARADLEYAGSPNQFVAHLAVPGGGLYEILVYAFDPRSGNTGIDRTTVFVE